MLQKANDHKQRHLWGKMKKRGHLLNTAMNILIWLGSYAFVRLVHILCSRLGWVGSPGSTSMEDILLLGVFAGVIVGELEWSDMKRKFEGLGPGEDRTMI